MTLDLPPYSNRYSHNTNDMHIQAISTYLWRMFPLACSPPSVMFTALSSWNFHLFEFETVCTKFTRFLQAGEHYQTKTRAFRVAWSDCNRFLIVHMNHDMLKNGCRKCVHTVGLFWRMSYFPGLQSTLTLHRQRLGKFVSYGWWVENRGSEARQAVYFRERWKEDKAVSVILSFIDV